MQSWGREPGGDGLGSTVTVLHRPEVAQLGSFHVVQTEDYLVVGVGCSGQSGRYRWQWGSRTPYYFNQSLCEGSRVHILQSGRKEGAEMGHILIRRLKIECLRIQAENTPWRQPLRFHRRAGGPESISHPAAASVRAGDRARGRSRRVGTPHQSPRGPLRSLLNFRLS